MWICDGIYAIAQKKNIVFFCYSPHHMFSLYDLVALKEPAHDKAKWKVIQPTDDPDWLKKSDAAVAWADAKLHIHYAASLEKSQPAAAKILSKVKFDTKTISAMTYALVVKKADPVAYAKKWVADNGSTVDNWLK